MPCHASSSSSRSRLTLKSATGSAPRNRSSCPKLRSYRALLGSTFPHILALITFSMFLYCFWSFFHPPSTCWQMSRSFWAAWGSLWLWLLRQQVFQYRSLHSKHHLKHPSQCVRLSRSQRTCKDWQVTRCDNWLTYFVPRTLSFSMIMPAVTSCSSAVAVLQELERWWICHPVEGLHSDRAQFGNK